MQITRFTNSEGRAIKGVLFRARGATGVIYLPGIVLGSTAVHRLGIELAHRLAGEGAPVYLFDHDGVGESEGEHPTGTHAELGIWVESGALLGTTLQAIDFFVAQTRVERVILVGHCGGALTSAYAAARHPRVAGAFLINPPVVRMGAVAELDREGTVDQYFALYRRKLFSIEAWRRLLGGQTSYRQLSRVLKNKFLRRRKPTQNGGPHKFNPMLQDSIARAVDDGKRVAVVYGDREPDQADFADFCKRCLPREVPVEIFPNASHGYVTEESEARLFDAVSAFTKAL